MTTTQPPQKIGTLSIGSIVFQKIAPSPLLLEILTTDPEENSATVRKLGSGSPCSFSISGSAYIATEAQARAFTLAKTQRAQEARAKFEAELSHQH
jgi:hypothetical protein